MKKRKFNKKNTGKVRTTTNFFDEGIGVSSHRQEPRSSGRRQPSQKLIFSSKGSDGFLGDGF